MSELRRVVYIIKKKGLRTRKNRCGEKRNYFHI